MNRSILSILIVALAGGIAVGAIIISLQPRPGNTCGNWWVQPPCPNQEGLAVDSYYVNSPTNITLKIVNIGSIPMTLLSYTVRDSFNNQYANTSWSGPSMVPQAMVTTNILIDGKTFTFQTGNNYTIEILTDRDSRYFFQITA